MTPPLPDPPGRTPGIRPPWTELPDLVVAIIPMALTVLLLISGFTPILKSLSDPNVTWTGFSYQATLNKVAVYLVAVQTPDTSAATLARLRDQARASLSNRVEHTDLDQVEAIGPARLARADELFNTGLAQTLPEARRHFLKAAFDEAAFLNEQAHERIHTLQHAHALQLNRLRLVLLLAAALSGLLSAALILRSLRLWRHERQLLDGHRELISLASHELRRPLQSLLLATDLLRLADTPEDQRRYLSVVETSAAQLASRANLDQLESMYRQVTLDWQLLDLGALLLEFHGPRTQVLLPEAPVEVFGDPARLRQIIENLHENALRYSTGEVVVSLRLHERRPEIQIRDFGPGIDPADVERLFLPRQRGHQQAGLQGLGLGLTIARRLAQAHGADLTLQAAPGGGTLAVLRLKAARVPGSGPNTEHVLRH